MLIDDEESAVIETTEVKLVSSNAVMNTELTDHTTVASTEQNVNPSCSHEIVDSIEIQDSSDESGIGTTVDEQEAGPSGVPVEWQEAATVVRSIIFNKVEIILFLVLKFLQRPLLHEYYNFFYFYLSWLIF